MSARAKIRPSKLGKRTVDAFYPVVCGPSMIAQAKVTAHDQLVTLAGLRRTGAVEYRVYLGADKAVQVLEALREGGGGQADDRYGQLVDTAAGLAEHAVLVLASCRVLA